MTWPLMFFLLTVASVITADNNVYDTQYFMDENCGRTIYLNKTSNSYGILAVTRNSAYSHNMDCTVRLQAATSYRVLFRFRFVEFATPYSCCAPDYLQIIGLSYNNSLCFCGLFTPLVIYTSSSNVLIFTIRTLTYSTSHDGFGIYYNVFHTGDCDDDSEFECHNDRCITEELKCDERDNCGDYSDESNCGLSTAIIITISVVCSVVFLAVVFGVVYWFVLRRKKKKSEKQRREQNNVTAPLNVDPVG